MGAQFVENAVALVLEPEAQTQHTQGLVVGGHAVRVDEGPTRLGHQVALPGRLDVRAIAR